MPLLSSSFTSADAPASSVSGDYKVDISRGERIGRVSSEWFSRPRRREVSVPQCALRGCPCPRRPRERPHRRDPRAPGRGKPRQRRTHGADRARPGRAGRADPLVFRPDVQPGRCARRLPAPASRSAGGDQHAARPAVAPGRIDQDARSRRRPGRAARRHRAGLWPHLGPRTGLGGDEDRRRRRRRHALEGAGPAGLVDDATQPVRRGDEGHDHPLRQRPRRLPVPGRRHAPDRGRTPARTATRTSTSAASIAGTARSARRRWAWRRSSCAPSA